MLLSDVFSNIFSLLQVKVVNYIKKQIQLQRCIFCETDTDNVLEHMKNDQHYKIPMQKVWDQPQLVHIIKIKCTELNKIFLFNLYVLFIPGIISLYPKMTHFYTTLTQLAIVMRKAISRISMKQRK